MPATAFARVGPAERDTRGMAESLGWKEPYVGLLILVPAVLDIVRYYNPDARWADVGIARGENRRRRADRALGGCGFDPGPEREGHGAFDDDLAVDAGDAVQDAHPAAQPADQGLDLDHVARVHGTPIADALDAGEERQALPVLWLGENQDRADLGDRFREDGGGQRRRFAVPVRQVALVQGDVLDPDDPLVDFDLGNTIN